MQGPARKLVQAVLYEAIAIAVLSPAISLIYEDGLAHAGALSLMLSASALIWNMLYNTAFECWNPDKSSARARSAVDCCTPLASRADWSCCWCRSWRGGWTSRGGPRWSPTWGCSCFSSSTRWCFSGRLIGCSMCQRLQRRATRNPMPTCRSALAREDLSTVDINV